MRILLVCENYYPHLGGAEVLFKNIAEGFCQKGHEVSVLTHLLRGTAKQETVNQVKINRVPSLHSRYIFTFSSLFQAIKLAKKHDIIQTTTFNAAFPAWLVGKVTRKPVVLTVHEVWAGKWKEITGFSWLKSAVHELLERMIYLLPFDKYICVSHATRKDLLRRGIKEKKIEVVYNGIDYNFWDPKKVKKEEVQHLREKLGLNNKFVFFSWGRAGASKGFEYAIKAIPRVTEKTPQATLLLMLSVSPQYHQKCRELLQLIKKVNSNIAVIPSLSYPELRTILAASDCAVIPSVAEGFGFNAAEVAAMGKPLIASDAGSLPEIVSGKHLLFESKNEEDLAEKMEKMMQKKFHETIPKRFEWNSCIEEYITEYTKLLEQK